MNLFLNFIKAQDDNFSNRNRINFNSLMLYIFLFIWVYHHNLSWYLWLLYRLVSFSMFFSHGKLFLNGFLNLFFSSNLFLFSIYLLFDLIAHLLQKFNWCYLLLIFHIYIFNCIVYFFGYYLSFEKRVQDYYIFIYHLSFNN